MIAKNKEYHLIFLALEAAEYPRYLGRDFHILSRLRLPDTELLFDEGKIRSIFRTFLKPPVRREENTPVMSHRISQHKLHIDFSPAGLKTMNAFLGYRGTALGTAKSAYLRWSFLMN